MLCGLILNPLVPTAFFGSVSGSILATFFILTLTEQWTYDTHITFSLSGLKNQKTGYIVFSVFQRFKRALERKERRSGRVPTNSVFIGFAGVSITAQKKKWPDSGHFFFEPSRPNPPTPATPRAPLAPPPRTPLPRAPSTNPL